MNNIMYENVDLMMRRVCVLGMSHHGFLFPFLLTTTTTDAVVTSNMVIQYRLEHFNVENYSDY